MPVNFLPKTRLGKWSVGLIIAFFLFSSFRELIESLGQSALIQITIILTVVCGVATFFTGIIGIIKSKERSILVFLTTLMGFFLLCFSLIAILFPS